MPLANGNMEEEGSGDAQTPRSMTRKEGGPPVPDEAYIEVQVGGHQCDSPRFVALIDATDAAMVGAYSWSMHSAGYAVRYVRVGGKKLAVLMHRELLGLVPGDPRQADHVSGDKLDNRRRNLRVCTDAQNQQNLYHCGPYRGTTWDASRSLWQAQARLAGKQHNLGRFTTREEAAAVASAYRREHMPFSADARA